MTTARRKTIYSAEQRALSALLADAREKADVTQAKLAKRLGRAQSFVAKYEGGQRRLDVVEFLAIARALSADPVRLLRALMRQIG